AFPFTLFTLALHNISLISERVPNQVFSQCGIDVNRWYPLPRRMVDTARFMLTRRRDRERQRQVLDIVRDRFDVRCGPLIQAAR
ncbi:MAG: potassium transporter, partial [Mycobacterium sp.]